MTTIAQIIEELNLDNGSNYKMDILRKHKDNETLPRVLKMTYDKVSHTYGITMKNVPEYKSVGNRKLEDILDIIEAELVTRNTTGNSAMELLTNLLGSTSTENAKIIEGVINRDLRINMGRSNINKVFKGLIVKPPYMRCGIYTAKTAKKINFPGLVQLKADGMFQAVTVDQGTVTFTARSGETREFMHLVNDFKALEDGVYIGELLVHGEPNRALANGIINSDDSKENVYMQLWDYVTLDEYSRGKDKKNKTFYIDRFTKLESIIENSPEINLDSNVVVIETHRVDNIKEAMSHTSRWMALGLEGAILKDDKNLFIDHTSPTQLKLKLEIDAEVRVTGFTQGKIGTKREATFGALTFENDEGTIKGQTSGFTDKMITELHNNRDEYIGRVMTVQFNDITKGRDNDYYALSHPRFVEFRDDKNTTDTLERVQESREMAMLMEDR